MRAQRPRATLCDSRAVLTVIQTARAHLNPAFRAHLNPQLHQTLSCTHDHPQLLHPHVQVDPHMHDQLSPQLRTKLIYTLSYVYP